ncbi:hypothetical protein FDP41_011509 [Naegleria fowleri]|uniref:Transmembrane protein n=1 Tax=Naegleria fowleri TaxID=5763 RepID=A0A6A5CBD9_NAEFO|nr:uncharacterized protein FDP41_011509 [Naegleria fowleri]KAF0982579.1 hypothetical protein FDP41_011509 [Naegleria fowleri]CAG4709188.1 unnamed protein product [Naegleria fowleri]
MKRSKSYSSVLNLEHIQGLYELSEEEKQNIQRRKQIEHFKKEVKQLRRYVEEIKTFRDQWVWVKYARKVVMITHLITAVYIMAEKTLRVLNISLYRTVSHQLSFSQLMKSWMQNKFEQSNSLQNLKDALQKYHENVSRQYQEQKQRRSEYLQYLASLPPESLNSQSSSTQGGLLSYISSLFGSDSGARKVSTNILDFMDPSDGLTYFGDDGVFASFLKEADGNASAFNSFSSLKTEHFTNTMTRSIFASQGFRAIARLFWKETLQSGSLIFLVYWFGKQNIRKRVFATILLFLFNVYMLVFDMHSGSSARFRTILRWNVIFNILSLVTFLLFKQHLNITTEYFDQRYLKD